MIKAILLPGITNKSRGHGDFGGLGTRQHHRAKNGRKVLSLRISGVSYSFLFNAHPE
jgi:hypothetical protein